MPETKTDKAITMAEFNKQVRDWTYRVRSRALSRLNDATTGDASGKGKRSLKPSMKYDYGEVYSTGFHFLYYLVFIHYGVGNGYIRSNGTVMRGRKDSARNLLKKSRSYENDSRPVARHGFDWLDIEIRNSFEEFADIVQEYHGDKAAQEIFNQKDKLLIEKQ